MVNKRKICFKRSGLLYIVSKMDYASRLVHYISKEALIEANRRFPKRPPIIHNLNYITEIDFENMLATPISNIINDKSNK